MNNDYISPEMDVCEIEENSVIYDSGSTGFTGSGGADDITLDY